MIREPRLFEGGKFTRIIHPAHVSLTENIRPLSVATVELREGDSIPMRSMAELFSPLGSAGIFRARSPQDAYGGENAAVEFEHMACELGDWLVRDEISEMMDPQEAVRQIFSHYRGNWWQLGSISALGGGKVSVDVNHDNVLNSILSVMDQKYRCAMAFDFGTTPWTVSIVKLPDTVSAECRLSRNVTEARITYDDTQMCTRVYYELTRKNGSETKTEWKSIDAPTIKPPPDGYGVIERTVSTSSELTDEEALEIAQTFLEEHQDPRVGVEIEGVSLADITGEELDRFETGKLLRLTIPEYGVRVEKNIRSMSWPDVYGEPKRVIVNIGDEEDTVVSFIHNLDATGSGGGRKGGGGGGGGKNKKEKEEVFKQFETQYIKNDYEIKLVAKENADLQSIVKQAGMELDRNGVLIYSRSSPINLQSLIDAQANRIDLVVKGYGPDATLDVASIVTGINKREGSFIKLSAKQIDLSGYVRVEDLTVDYLVSKIQMASQINVNRLNAGTLTVMGGGAAVGVQTAFNNMDLTLSENTYTLKLTRISGQTVEKTFSRAIASGSATWSDGQVHVTLQPQNQVFDFNIPTISQSCTNPAAFNFLITASVGGKSRRYRLIVSETGGRSSFEPY